MPRNLLAKVPAVTVRNDMTGNPITTAAWATLVAAVGKACTAVEIFNPSGSTIQLSLGAAGQELTALIPYTVLPGGSSILLPIEISSGKRISAKAVDQNATTGIFTMNLFG